MRFKLSTTAGVMTCIASGLAMGGAHGLAVFFALTALLDTIADATNAIVDAIREDPVEVQRFVCVGKED